MDAQDAYQYTKDLSFPRLVGTNGQKKAANYIANKFKEFGIQVNREEFKCSNFPINFVFRVIAPVVGVLVLLMDIFYLLSQSFSTDQFHIIQVSPLAIIFSIITFILALMTPTIQTKCFGKFSNFKPNFRCENIVGEILSEDSKTNVILMGHYDTKSQLYPAIIRVFLFLIGIIWAMIISIIMFLGQILLLIGFSEPISSNSILFDLFHITFWKAFFPFIINFLLIFNYVGNKSPGAIDNASAVGIILALAKKFQENPLKNVNLYFAATDAEELGLYGAAAYIQKHKSEFDPKNTYFLNYDSPAVKGKIKLLTSYGIPKRSTSKVINKILFKIAKEHEINIGSIYLPFGAATDHVPIQAKGYEIAVMVSLVRRVHTKKDSIEYISVEGLQIPAILGYEFAKRINTELEIQ